MNWRQYEEFLLLFGLGNTKSLMAAADYNGFIFLYDLDQHTVHRQVTINEPKRYNPISLAGAQAASRPPLVYADPRDMAHLFLRCGQWLQHLDIDAGHWHLTAKRIWSSMPLDLNLDSSDSGVSFLSPRSISSILSSHRGPIRRFCVTTFATVGTQDWLRTLAERRVDDTLTLKWAIDLEQPTLPRKLLGSAGVGLRRLDLHCCRLGLTEDPSSPVPVLPRLDYLYLSDVLMSETGLHRMIEACPVLRELHLFMIHGLRRVVFRSYTLTTMDISTPCVPLDEFSVRDMPNLASLTVAYTCLRH